MAKRVVNSSSRDEVVKNIADGAARYIARRSVEETPKVEDSIYTMHDVVRHLMSKIGSERRKGERRK